MFFNKTHTEMSKISKTIILKLKQYVLLLYIRFFNQLKEETSQPQTTLNLSHKYLVGSPAMHFFWEVGKCFRVSFADAKAIQDFTVAKCKTVVVCLF